MNRRGWTITLGCAVALALVSLASNVTTQSQMDGQADTLLAVRMTISKLLNAGTVWAGLGVLAGWLVRRPGQAFVAGIAAGLTALVVHYAVGRMTGMFDAGIWVSNALWFLAAAMVGGPLGLVGALARRPGVLGLLAALVVPAGAVVEPFFTGQFTTPDLLPWPTRAAEAVSGSIVLGAGLLGCAAILTVRGRRRAASRVA